MEMKTLHLTLKKKWFDMILSGEKKEEYREVKSYWTTRLMLDGGKERFTKNESDKLTEAIRYGFEDSWGKSLLPKSTYKQFSTVLFKNGYSKDAPTIEVEFAGLKISRGKEEWGADPNDFYYTIVLGDVIDTKVLGI